MVKLVINPDPNPTPDKYPTYQTINGRRQFYDPLNNYILVNGVRHPLGLPQVPTSDGGGGGVAPAPAAPQQKFTFDTLGQTIFRSIGHCRLPLRTIWAQGVDDTGEGAASATQTFAAAMCAPIDPLEEGEIFAIWAGGDLVYNSSGPVAPTGWTPQDADLLSKSLANTVIFPGDEAQLPASLIVADKGADKTNAFRGIRYIIIPDYPINGGNGSGIPQLSVGWMRTNDADDGDDDNVIPDPGGNDDNDTGAVLFAAGSL